MVVILALCLIVHRVILLVQSFVCLSVLGERKEEQNVTILINQTAVSACHHNIWLDGLINSVPYPPFQVVVNIVQLPNIFCKPRHYCHIVTRTLLPASLFELNHRLNRE